MEELSQSNPLATVFPAPPPFYQSFTPTNIQKFAAHRAKVLGSDKNIASDTSTLLADLPAELVHLQPPELPTAEDGKFRCFGDVYYIFGKVKEDLPSLEAMGVEQVYTPPTSPARIQSPSQDSQAHHDRAFILKRLAKSLLLNFLELLGVLATNPSLWTQKVQDIRTLAINFHHLLNEYRPHQARESLIMIMREQLAKKKAEIQGVRECGERVEKILEGLVSISLDEPTVYEKEPEVDIEEIIWESMEKELA
ncbi:BgTH12-00414 [Blumeria graminis f. sp. triticale]|uniref:Mediator of RNA polymerase II transcription subunit 7 n=3 Tax=Blumeria graminis TaxID=34373 RepID=A0A061HHP8_BLUGR|nr:Subunit of the RNA polymerase II mediator complex [Blumeria graminis f. sp. tritici 96224]CAD6504914.1 BgTH12-00414 [Blumeria graminis f. sp. triticale]VDB92933.1 Bgt-1788 [Blumeria graminis f. sp. tritici]